MTYFSNRVGMCSGRTAVEHGRDPLGDAVRVWWDADGRHSIVDVHVHVDEAGVTTQPAASRTSRACEAGMISATRATRPLRIATSRRPDVLEAGSTTCPPRTRRSGGSLFLCRAPAARQTQSCGALEEVPARNSRGASLNPAPAHRPPGDRCPRTSCRCAASTAGPRPRQPR